MSEMEVGYMLGLMVLTRSSPSEEAQAEVEADLRRGPWTADEDHVLVNSVAVHGEGRWNSLARSAGLKRSGKSCRLRWLNYLRPDVRRGNITPEEQLLILELHSRWGNRWSKIAQHLPGRTDNEIKNYWRTRVQKHAKQLKCDANSQQFKEAVRRLWIPRLLEKIQAAAASSSASSAAAGSQQSSCAAYPYAVDPAPPMAAEESMHHTDAGTVAHVMMRLSPEDSSTAATSSDSSAETWPLSAPVSNLGDSYYVAGQGESNNGSEWSEEFPAGELIGGNVCGGYYSETPLSPSAYLNLQGFPDLEQSGWGVAGGFSSESFWADDTSWVLQQQQ